MKSHVYFDWVTESWGWKARKIEATGYTRRWSASRGLKRFLARSK